MESLTEVKCISRRHLNYTCFKAGLHLFESSQVAVVMVWVGAKICVSFENISKKFTAVSIVLPSYTKKYFKIIRIWCIHLLLLSIAAVGS